MSGGLGAHLARVGYDQTCIGIKQPGRIAYLSSISINIHNGQMRQELANNAHMAEEYDLDTPIQRYPQWFASPAVPHGTSLRHDERLLEQSKKHTVNDITLLPRDRLIWLAMVIEMATQRMSATQSSEVELSEVAVRALGLDSRNTTNLPVAIQPNWQIEDLKLSEVFVSLGLSKWERRYLVPAISGLTSAHFLPIGDQVMALNLDTRELTPWQSDRSGISYHDYFERHAEVIAATVDMIGTRSEVWSARYKIMCSNLANYLLLWGNRRFELDWKSFEPQLRELLTANLPKALACRCSTITLADMTHGAGVTLYTQSAKHRTFRPNCFFNGKKPMTHFATLQANNSQDLIEILGLEDESKLPAFLQGWSRKFGWTTSDRTAKAPTCERWQFADTGRNNSTWRKFCAAKVCFNARSVGTNPVSSQLVD